MNHDILLMRLNQDCLDQIFALLRPEAGLRPLSLTCKWVRSRSMPILFERCLAFADKLHEMADGFPPPCVWPYIRILTLRECFPHPPIYGFPDSAYDGFTFHEETLSHALNSMPQLYSVAIVDRRGIGIPWPILSAMMSVPHLREFYLQGRLFRSEERPPSDPPPWPAARLTTFRYTPNYLRPEPRSCASEEQVLATILGRFCGSLERLAIPSESAPFVHLNRWDWPRLRELVIEGDARLVLNLQVSLVSVLSTLPRLRLLALKLEYSFTDKLPPIWPPEEHREELPWPDLESLTLSWAHQDDRIFEHLPPSLRRLSVRTWPRSHGYGMRRLSRWQGSVSDWPGRELSCSDVLRVLRGCRATAPRLERLELEYEVDAHDLALLRLLPAACPDLQVLYFHRNRALGDPSAIPVVRRDHGPSIRLAPPPHLLSVPRPQAPRPAPHRGRSLHPCVRIRARRRRDGRGRGAQGGSVAGVPVSATVSRDFWAMASL
ncbi:hypothetical protein OH77DRAFT_1076665 [Trametes cingulata]|nr:hypothetical protein OH77DRAFT_1076665 [Trametes cingulata]